MTRVKTLLDEIFSRCYNGTVIGGSEEVARVLDIIKVTGPTLGLELNIKKTELFWPSCDGSKFRDGLL